MINIYSVLNLFLYSYTGFLIVLFFGLPFIGRKHSINFYSIYLNAVLRGLFILVLSSYIVSIFGFGLKLYFKIAFLICLLIQLSKIIMRFSFYRTVFIKNRNQILKFFTITFFGVSVSIFTILLPFVYFTRLSSYLPIMTLGNNDSGSYLAQATAISNSGFIGDDFIQNANYYNFTRIRDYGGPALLSYLSSVLMLPLWETFIIALVVVLSMIFLASYTLLITALNLKSIDSILISSLVIFNPIIFYLVGNNFLTQIISIFSWICLLYGIVQVTRHNELNRLDKIFTIAASISLALYSYPHMGVIHLILLFLTLIFVKIYQKSFKENVNIYLIDKASFKIYFYGVLISIVFSIPILLNSIKLFFERANADVGWSLNIPVTFANLFIVADFENSSLLGVWLILSLLLLIIITVSIKRVLKNYKFNDSMFKSFFLFLITITFIIPLFIYSILGLIYGFSSYRSWKFIFSFFPLLVPILLIKFSKQKKIFLSLSRFFLLLFAFTYSNYNLWEPTIRDSANYEYRITSKDLFDLRQTLSYYKFRSLNVELSPYFETMIAATIVPSSKVFINSPSYDMELIDVNTCTLVRNDDLKYSYSNGIRLNSTYKIVFKPNRCLVN